MRNGLSIAMAALWMGSLAAVAFAQEDQVVETFVGAVIKTDDSVESGTVEKLASGAVRVTRSDNIKVTIPADQIKEVRHLRTVMDDFDDQYKKLDRTQAKSFWDLADWCKHQQDTAREPIYKDQLKQKQVDALKELIKLFENSQDATNKAYALYAVRRLELLNPPPPPPPTRPVVVTGDGIPEPKALTNEEIQQICWQEWSRADRVRPMIPSKVLLKYKDMNLGTLKSEQLYDAVMSLPEEDKKLIEFRTDVQALREFKTRINAILVRSCATQQNCHGGPSAKKWRLVDKPSGLSRGELYANFKIIQPYLNRDIRERSPLLRAGLKYDPMDRTETSGVKDHPPSMAAVPIWRSSSDPDYRAVAKWIGELRKTGFSSPLPFPPELQPGQIWPPERPGEPVFPGGGR